MALNASPKVAPIGAPATRMRSKTRSRKAWSCSPVSVVVDVHRGDELAAVLEQRRQLGGLEADHVLDVVGFVGLEQQQHVGPVVRQILVGEEERIAGGDDAVDGEPAGVAVIGVQPVALPRIVAEHDVGTQLADPVARHRLALGQAGLELAVDLGRP